MTVVIRAKELRIVSVGSMASVPMQQSHLRVDQYFKLVAFDWTEPQK